MIIIGCSKGTHLAQKVARKLRTSYSELGVKKFPDGETSIRFMKDVKGKEVVLVQSFYGNINDLIIEVFFAAETARELGAKKVILAAPYFPYFRQDKRFKPGQSISIEVLAGLINKYFDGFLVVDPHLHREKNLSELFNIRHEKLSANQYMGKWIKKNIKNPLIVGPDWESYKWARKVAEEIGCDHVIMEKKRFSGRDVKVTLNKKVDLTNKNIILVDDMISTGNTIIEAANNFKRMGVKRFNCVAVHGIFVEKALERLKKNMINVVTTNTIPGKAAKIDISDLIVEGIKKDYTHGK
ncbi:MAG: ribose-phosphate diphosphokinase [Candidatus Woesearchaeota archaeon]